MSKTILIGERINSTNKRVKRVLDERDEEALLELANRQSAGGASFIDVNASMLMMREAEALSWAAGCIAAANLGVSLDSPNADLLLDVLPSIEGEVILNSFTCDADPLVSACAAAAEHGAGIIVMLKDRHGIPATVEGRLALADTAVAVAKRASLPPERIYIDPVFSPVATAADGLGVVLGTLAALTERYPRHHRIGGLSNISFGLPDRRLLNRTFLAMALSRGLDAAICDTTDAGLMETVTASEALVGLDHGCGRFLQCYREKKSR
jgi:5-methyltetrahydrofolate--homocysteine methyltransferase